MTRHKVYPTIKVYKKGKLLRTTTAGSRSKIDSAEAIFNCDLIGKSDVKVYVDVEVSDGGHGKVSLRFDGNLFELSINGKDVNECSEVCPLGHVPVDEVS